MALVHVPANALAWLGRQGTRAVALSIFVGLAVPQLAAVFKPHLGAFVFVLLLFSFLRVDPRALWHHVTAPKLVLAASAWVMLVTSAVFGALYTLLGLSASFPALYLILILQMAAPPITSAPALAALIGLDVALSLGVLILCTAVTPVVTPAFASLFLGTSLISPLELGAKLFFFLAGAAAASAVIRGVAGRKWVEAQRDRIDGVNVIALFAFAVAAMDGVGPRLVTEPGLIFGLLALTFTLTLVVLGLTVLVFIPAGRNRALAIGLLACNRNIAVLMAAIGSSVPETAWLYFAMAQFPIYLMPQFLRAFAPRPR
jgi:BASS family bile acid:Na+ symporter